MQCQHCRVRLDELDAELEASSPLVIGTSLSRRASRMTILPSGLIGARDVLRCVFAIYPLGLLLLGERAVYFLGC
jgi:hypothetical protein